MIGILVSNVGFTQESVPLKKDDRAPFEGVLLSLDKANKVRYDLLECDIKKSLNESYEKTIKLYKDNENIHQEKINVLLKQNDDLAKAVIEARSSTDIQKIIWFGLGVLATGLAIYAGKEMAK